jgi:hypothetical protein
VDAVGWRPGDRLHWRLRDGLIIVSRPGYGTKAGVAADGGLRLPAHIRRAAGLLVGDRVLLAADLTHGIVVVFGPAVLDEMVARRFAGLAEGALS